MMKYKVLIADDEEGVRDLCTAIAEDEGYEVITAVDGIDALQKIREEIPDVILLDVRMPDMDGMEVFQKLKEDFIDAPVIFVTAFGSSDLAIEAMKQGAYDYITKPFDVDEIRIVLKKALYVKQLTKEISTLRSSSYSALPKTVDLVGSSHIMQDVFKNIGMVAKNNAPVLIDGEAGTECDQVAQTLYEKSAVSEGTFCVVSCYEDTDALQEECANIQTSANATIYLKNIQLLSKKGQEVLFQKISKDTLSRFVSSSTVDISEKVKQGQFHEQLFFKLSTVRIHLPPLRERIEDIEEVGLHLLEDLNARYEKNVKGFSSDALDIFKAYSWPGNVEEFKNVLTHSIISAKSNFITKENLPTFLFHKSTEQKVDPDDIYLGLTLSEATKKFELEYIQRVLQMQGGNKTKTAEILGISRRSLFNKLRSYELLGTLK
ncbi:MAG: sigma-54 dependent transcriptional regulator [Caldisericia bacterium]|nr:sigma-54 dependent transcriptional regulator [Caldisericia bacterium]MDD4615163.1 sigma-54 dependent transcriptional regulator [Caldisericia bacterium]